MSKNTNLILTHIYAKDEYISNLSSDVKNDEKELLSHFVKNNIAEYIDKKKVRSNVNTYEFTFNNKLLKFNNKFIFAQIIGFENIAAPKENPHKKDYDNLDEVDDDDNKFLQGSDSNSNAKTEKLLVNFQFTTDGEDRFCGFEHYTFDAETAENIKKINGKSCVKALIGPNFRVRRGFVYLNRENFKIFL